MRNLQPFCIEILWMIAKTCRLIMASNLKQVATDFKYQIPPKYVDDRKDLSPKDSLSEPELSRLPSLLRLHPFHRQRKRDCLRIHLFLHLFPCLQRQTPFSPTKEQASDGKEQRVPQQRK